MAGKRSSSRWSHFGVALLLVGAFLVSVVPAVAQPRTTRVSVTTGDPGGEVDEMSTQGAISANGRYVAFVSRGAFTDDVFEPPNYDPLYNIYVRDRVANETHLVTRRIECEPDEIIIESVDDVSAMQVPSCDWIQYDDAVEPAISADGRFVAFSMAGDSIEAVNLPDWVLSEFSEFGPHVYVTEMLQDPSSGNISGAGDTEIVSLTNEVWEEEDPEESWVFPMAGQSREPSISHDGQRIAFQSTGELDMIRRSVVDVYVRDRGDAVTARVSYVRDLCEKRFDTTAITCFDTNGLNRRPSIAGDGASLAFESNEGELDVSNPPEGEGAGQQVYRHELPEDLEEIETASELLSVDEEGMPGNWTSQHPSASGDGSRIAFATEATNLAEGADSCDQDVFPCGDVVVWEQGSSPLLRSATSASGIATGAELPALSADGSTVAYAAYHVDEESCPSLCSAQVFVTDLFEGNVEPVAVNLSGEVDPNAYAYDPSISADGRAVAFESTAPDLVEGDDNNRQDVFVRDRRETPPPPPPRVPRASVAPDALDFGDVVVGDSSAPQDVTVTSVGTAPLVVSAVALDGPGAATFTSGGDCVGAVLAPGAACTISVTFTPAIGGPQNAGLVVSTNAANSPHLVRLTGNGTVAAMSIVPNPVVFGLVPVGSASSERVVTVSSVGTAPLPLTTVTLAGAQPAEFEIVTQDCASATLPPGATCTIVLRFRPAEIGAREATLTVDRTGGSPGEVSLQGVGARALLDLSPDPVLFGLVPVGETSGPAIVTARNIGTWPLQISGIALAGPDLGDFQVSGDTCTGALLDPGELCTMVVRFTAGDEGPRVATLLVSNTTDGSPHGVALMAAGEAQEPGPGPGPGPEPVDTAKVIEVTPQELEFDPQLAEVPTRNRAVTVRSIGTAAISVTRVALDGDGEDSFELVADRCSDRQLLPGTACTVTVRFVPVDSGLHEADVAVTSDAERGRSRATLRGTGLVPQVTLDPPLARRGFVTFAKGEDFPAGIDLDLRWDPGIGRFTVRTDDEGAFELPIVLLRRDRLGPRVLETTATQIEVLTDFLVVPGSLGPPDFTIRD
jgi:Tol biopolymer transport system component